MAVGRLEVLAPVAPRFDRSQTPADSISLIGTNPEVHFAIDAQRRERRVGKGLSEGVHSKIRNANHRILPRLGPKTPGLYGQAEPLGTNRTTSGLANSSSALLTVVRGNRRCSSNHAGVKMRG